MFVTPRGFVHFPMQGDIISFSFPQETAKTNTQTKNPERKELEYHSTQLA